MIKAVGAFILLAVSQAAGAAGTDFGIRTVGGAARNDERMGFDQPEPGHMAMPATQSIDLGAIKNIGSRWGRVTSTYRSPAHNRHVGGVANSYHLRSRAIDIARRAGVSHWQIASAYRAAGYNLIESLDEGDHSHFAFGRPGEGKQRRGIRPQMVIAQAGEKTEWRIVYAPSSSGSN